LHQPEALTKDAALSFAGASGNSFQVTADITVTLTATLIKDLGRKDLPTITPSVTLLKLLGLL
jgi:hypothetical protein